MAVGVVVEHRRPRRPEAALGARAGAGVAEGAVAVVEVEHVPAQVRQVQVGPAVVVDVADRQAVGEAPEPDPRPLGDVLEGAVPPVPVEPVPLRLRRAIQRELAGRGEVEVEPAVAVVVEHRHAAAVGRGEVLLGAVAAPMREGDPRRLGGVAEADRRRLGGLRGSASASETARSASGSATARVADGPASGAAASMRGWTESSRQARPGVATRQEEPTSVSPSAARLVHDLGLGMVPIPPGGGGDFLRRRSARSRNRSASASRPTRR